MTTIDLAETISTSLPVFNDVRAWYGPDLAEKTDWISLLDADDIAEIDAAVAHVMSVGLDLAQLRKEQFPLPRLAARLEAIRHSVLHGIGFVLLRGWPSKERTLAQSATAYFGIGAHLGEALSQNNKGHTLGHVTNTGLNYADPTTRGYQTNAELRFHTDAGDIVGLICIRPAKTGGLSKICSSTTVWNEIVKRSPQHAQALTETYSFTRWNEIGAGQNAFYDMSLFKPHGGRMIAMLVPSAIEKAQSFEGARKMTPLQAEALKLVNEIAEDPAIRLDMDFRPGDMQFICNHSTLHSRTSYEDWPNPEERRHLLRLWLACEQGPDLPDYFTTGFQDKTPSGRPNGIRLQGVPLVASLVP